MFTYFVYGVNSNILKTFYFAVVKQKILNRFTQNIHKIYTPRTTPFEPKINMHHIVKLCIFICLVVVVLIYNMNPWLLKQALTNWQEIWHGSCLNRRFKDILLIIVFNFPLYDHIPILQNLYNKAFPNMIFCGTETSGKYNIQKARLYKGYFGYECLTNAISKSSNYTGYLVASDDVLVNFWNFIDKDTSLIWEGPGKPITIGTFSRPDHWYWWKSRWGLLNCVKSLNEIKKTGKYTNSPKMYENLVVNRIGNTTLCHRGRSDIYYLPRKHAKDFRTLAKIFRTYDVFIEIAIPTILRMLDSSSNFVRLAGIYLPGRVGTEPVVNSKHLWDNYTPDHDFIHPVKLHYGKNSTSNILVLKHYIQKKIDNLVNC